MTYIFKLQSFFWIEKSKYRFFDWIFRFFTCFNRRLSLCLFIRVAIIWFWVWLGLIVVGFPVILFDRLLRILLGLLWFFVLCLELRLLLLGSLIIIIIWGDIWLRSSWVDIILLIIVVILSLVVWWCLLLSYLIWFDYCFCFIL